MDDDADIACMSDALHIRCRMYNEITFWAGYVSSPHSCMINQTLQKILK